ncbi:hypothetical protein PG5_02030 [Pseudomonas sp. G5(2012)]|nr:hypothetical protein PG5_02030 [Pseudomonas sp. G5(2012)]
MKSLVQLLLQKMQLCLIRFIVEASNSFLQSARVTHLLSA